MDTPDAKWRKLITELKLRVAHGSLFPYFVVTSRHFEDISPAIEATIVDGVIGKILASQLASERLSQVVDFGTLGVGEEDYNAMMEWEKQELVDNWALGVEVESEMEANPVERLKWQLMQEMGMPLCREKFLTYPNADVATNRKERADMIDNAISYGSRVTLEPEDIGEVTTEVWIPNFKVIGFWAGSLVEDLATILALDKLKRLRATRHADTWR